MRGWIFGTLIAVLACACGDDDGGSGASGTAGTGGTAGTAGSGGSGGTAGNAGSGGTGGTAGEAGNGGTGGSYVHVGTEACCTEHASPGCSDAAVEECVCAFNALCCTEGWNDACVALARIDNTVANCGTCKGSCCESKTTPGCDDAQVEACVCEGSAECCTQAWDSLCVSVLTLTELCGTSCQ